MLEDDLVKAKKKRCSEYIKQHYPEFLDQNGNVNYYALQRPSENLPTVALEYLVWDELESEHYWMSLNELHHIFQRGEDQFFSEQELIKITDIMIKQAMEGKNIACAVPLYDDVWNLLGKDKIIGKYVTEEHIKDAVNIGFWDLLEKTADSQKAHAAWEHISNALNYEGFFDCFNFRQGAEKADQINLDYDFHDSAIIFSLPRSDLWYSYAVWYLAQQEIIYKTFDRKKSNEICGKLATPTLYEVIHPSDYYIYPSEIEQLRKTIYVFIERDLLKTKPIQAAFGSFFEMYLMDGFIGFQIDSNVLGLLENSLINVDEHARRAWEEVKDRVDLAKVVDEIKAYIPQQKSYAENLRQKIESMERFDLYLFKNWMSLRQGIDVTKQVHGLVRNKVLNVYFSQKKRPSKEELKNMYFYVKHTQLGSGYITDKTKGFLFADLLRKRLWEYANEIILHYETKEKFRLALKREFLNGVYEYVEKHGRIRLSSKALKADACFPYYNRIADLNKKCPDLFEIISES